jgi:hypothetical protein
MPSRGRLVVVALQKAVTAQIEERRQRAREAFHDAPGLSQEARLQGAVETATRVRVTHEVLAVMIDVERSTGSRRRALEAALGALGFEVEP